MRKSKFSEHQIIAIPAVERGFTDPEFATDFCDRDAGFGLL